MGLFSTKKKTYVGTTVSRIIEDELLPNSIKTGGLTALVKDGESIDYIRDELLQGIGMRAESMYRYAKDNYANGMPSGQYFNSDIGEPEVIQVLESIEGLPVTVEYSRLGNPNGLHIGWMSLVNSHGYIPETNELDALSLVKGVPVYLEDMVLVVPTVDYPKYSASALAQWGIAANAGYTPSKKITNLKKLVQPSPIVLDDLAIEDYVKVTYVWKTTPLGPLYRDTFNIPIEGYDDNAEYFHVKYTVNGITEYWMYELGLGTYPLLDNLVATTPAEHGTYFPFIYFRYNKAPVPTDAGNMEYKTSRKALKYLGIDYDDMIEGINANADIDDVQQAMLLMAVPAVTTEPIEQRYLFDYFDSIYEANPKQFKFLDVQKKLLSKTNPDVNGFVIQDNKFKMSLRYSAVYKTRKSGAFPVEASGFYTENYTTEVMVTNGVEDHLDQVVDTNRIHFYRKKLTDTLYDEIQVHNLQVTYFVLGNHTVIADETDDILLIPIDHSISNKYNIMDREVLYSRSLHYVFNSVQIVKIKWYQQSFFKELLKIAAIVITVISFGADGGSLLAAIGSLSIATISAAVWAVLVKVFWAFVMEELFKVFVEAIGMDAALIFAVIAAAYGMYSKFANLNMQQFLWGDNLLKVATGLMSGIQATATGLMEDLMKDTSEFTKFVEEQTKILDDAKELLHNRVLLSPFVIFGETPKEYYDRTVHSGNIGVIGINAVGKYVDNALTLPKLRDVLGESNYG